MSKFTVEIEQSNGKIIKREFEALGRDEAVIMGEKYVETLQNLHGLYIAGNTVYFTDTGLIVL